MPSEIEDRLRAAGITLPTPTTPVANYVPFTVSGSTVFVSGQIPMRDGAIAYAGKIPTEVGPEAAREAAALCFVNVLAQVKVACGGDLGRVRRVLRLGGYVNAAPDFTAHATVMNGASDLAVAVFGDAGKHARSTIGVASLPGNAAFEVDAIFEIA